MGKVLREKFVSRDVLFVRRSFSKIIAKICQFKITYFSSHPNLDMVSNRAQYIMYGQGMFQMKIYHGVHLTRLWKQLCLRMIAIECGSSCETVPNGLYIHL